MPGKDLTPEDLEMVKRQIELKCENHLQKELRGRRVQRHGEEMRARLRLYKVGKREG